MDNFKHIHQQANKEKTFNVLHNFYETWEPAYKGMIKNLKAIEPDLLIFYNYPQAIRASIYITNLVESFNIVIKRKAKPKVEFPTEESLDTFIRVQAMEYNTRFLTEHIKGSSKLKTL